MRARGLLWWLRVSRPPSASPAGFYAGQQPSGLPCHRQVWPAFDCGNAPRRLTIASDGDDAGRQSAAALAERDAVLGWAVSLLPAPEGRDWNDVLMLKGEAA